MYCLNNLLHTFLSSFVVFPHVHHLNYSVISRLFGYSFPVTKHLAMPEKEKINVKVGKAKESHVEIFQSQDWLPIRIEAGCS